MFDIEIMRKTPQILQCFVYSKVLKYKKSLYIFNTNYPYNNFINLSFLVKMK